MSVCIATWVFGKRGPFDNDDDRDRDPDNKDGWMMLKVIVDCVTAIKEHL